MLGVEEPFQARRVQLFKRVVVLGAIVLLLLLVLPSVPATAAGAQGTVKDVNNNGVSGAFIMLFHEADHILVTDGYAITEANGNFTLLDYNPPHNPLSDATVNGINGFVMIQPAADDGPLHDQLGVYQHQPRAYVKPPSTSVDMVLPAASSFVLNGYKLDGTLMRWADYDSNNGAQFMYLTNMDEEMRPAVNWPSYDAWARQGTHRTAAGRSGFHR